MDYFAGLDVSVKETSVYIVDDTGRIVREVKVASEPDVLLAGCWFRFMKSQVHKKREHSRSSASTTSVSW